MQGLVSCSNEHFARCPGQFIVVHEFVPVMRNLLVGAVLAIFGNRLLEKFPTFFGLLQILRGTFWKLLFKRGRRSALGQRSDRPGRRSGRFRPDDLPVAMVGEHLVLVFSFTWIDQKIETTIV